MMENNNPFIGTWKLISWKNTGTDVNVAGHGNPGTKMDLTEHRTLLDSFINRSRQCFERGLSYDKAVETFEGDAIPAEFSRSAVLSGYCEWGSGMPASRNPADTNHIQILSTIARRAKLLMRIGGEK